MLGAYAESYTRVIAIKDREDSRPLELVTLSSEDPTVLVLSGAKGKVDITAFKGTDRIEIRSIHWGTTACRS